MNYRLLEMSSDCSLVVQEGDRHQIRKSAIAINDIQNIDTRDERVKSKFQTCFRPFKLAKPIKPRRIVFATELGSGIEETKVEVNVMDLAEPNGLVEFVSIKK